MIDMHVHILPGVDDGAQDEQMTRQMMQRAKDAGITYVVATPHVYRMQDQAGNRSMLRLTRSIAHEYGIGMAMGCEFNYRALLAADIRNLDTFCLAGTPCILLELPVDQMMPGWEGTVSEMIDCGYLPIIAHPERYAYVQRDIGIAHAMCDIGCELQVDACGLMAGLFGAERKTARKLVSEGMVSYIASDAHRPSDYDDYEKARRVFKAEWPRRNRLEDLLRARGKEKNE